MSKRECPECDGTGEYLDDIVEAAGFPTRITYPCGVCNGKGWLTKKQAERWTALSSGEDASLLSTAVQGEELTR